jgi:hypothetical protein
MGIMKNSNDEIRMTNEGEEVKSERDVEALKWGIRYRLKNGRMFKQEPAKAGLRLRLRGGGI